jgi:soluble lytic murein transglycosylase
VQSDEKLAPQDRVWYRKAFAFAEKGDWSRALQMAANARNPLPRKVLSWAYYRSRKTKPPFDLIADFIGDNPDWPAQDQLRRRAEIRLWEERQLSDRDIVAWFAKYPPLTGTGFALLGKAEVNTGNVAAGGKNIRHAWTHFTMAEKQASEIYRRHKRHLRPRDHEARLNRLLWEGHRQSAKRMLPRVSKGQRRLAEARIALMTRRGNVDAKIGRVEKKLRRDAGLVYERTRWRRRAKLYEGAWDLLSSVSGSPGTGLYPKAAHRWWVERRLLSRRALFDGRPQLAYNLASDHGQKAGTADYAESQWLAGWIALRHLHDAKLAYRHFSALYDAVKYPLSLSRASYWAARAATETGDKVLAGKWYAIAKSYPGTYYGQLAQEATPGQSTWSLPPEPEPDAAAQKQFDGRELVQAVRHLAELDQSGWARLIIYHLARNAKSPAEQILAARLAISIKRPDLSVRAAKIAARTGTATYRAGYPTMTLPPLATEDALIHAVTRQESEFYPRAVSRAGARGLMQLMPATARQVSRQQKLRYRRSKLFDPDYNIRLGAAYLDEQLSRFGGSYIMAVAAYNAGPHRVQRWIKTFGDPRSDKVDAIDWVESIPFTETRNYVQRVMENLQIFRDRLSKNGSDLSLSQDLRRGSKAAAPTL